MLAHHRKEGAMEVVESYPQRIWDCPKCGCANMIDDDQFILNEAHGQECMKCREIFIITD